MNRRPFQPITDSQQNQVGIELWSALSQASTESYHLDEESGVARDLWQAKEDLETLSRGLDWLAYSIFIDRPGNEVSDGVILNHIRHLQSLVAEDLDRSALHRVVVEGIANLPVTRE